MTVRVSTLAVANLVVPVQVLCDCQRWTWALLFLWFAAAEVVWWRSLRIAMGNLSPQEATRMMMEKPAAFAEAAEKAARAAASQKDPAEVAAALITPLDRRTNANAKRLRRQKL